MPALSIPRHSAHSCFVTDLAVDDGYQDIGLTFQDISVQDDHVGELADLQ